MIRSKTFARLLIVMLSAAHGRKFTALFPVVHQCGPVHRLILAVHPQLLELDDCKAL
jgi:hypothetical protein